MEWKINYGKGRTGEKMKINPQCGDSCGNIVEVDPGP